MADISLLPREYTTKVAPPTKKAKIFSILSFLLLFVVLGSWGGLYFYNNQLSQEIANLKSEMEEVRQGENQDQVVKINEANKKISTFEDKFKRHVYASNVFTEIEKFTLKKVYFGTFVVDVPKNLITLSGVTDSYTNFSKQYNELNNRTGIVDGVDIDSVRSSDDGVDFNLSLYLADSIFYKSN